MKKKTILFFAWFILVSSTSYAMDAKQFDSLMTNIHEGKFDLVESSLRTNETLLGKDPEYYVVLLNYVLASYNQTGIVAAKGAPQQDDVAVRDPKTGKSVGFIGQRAGHDEKLVVDGISRANKSLPFFKSRLDIRFGIIAAAAEIKRWDLLGDQLVETVNVSKEIDNKWTWGSINSMSGEPETFMLENIQGQISYLFRADDPTADDALIRASEALIKCYPEITYGYSNLGVLYLSKKEYDKADSYLKQALAIDPNDEIVKGNIELLKKNRKGK